MNKLFLLSIVLSMQSVYANDIVGYWKTIDEWEDRPQSIIGIYEHNDKFYGRIVATYNTEGGIKDTMDSRKEIAEGVEGNRPYCGLDIIWNLTKNGDKYTDGKIMDPEKGRVYDAEAWREGSDLIMRGEIKVFGTAIGRNGKWLPAAPSDFPSHFKQPDLTAFVPEIPEALKKHKD